MSITVHTKGWQLRQFCHSSCALQPKEWQSSVTSAQWGPGVYCGNVEGEQGDLHTRALFLSLSCLPLPSLRSVDQRALLTWAETLSLWFLFQKESILPFYCLLELFIGTCDYDFIFDFSFSFSIHLSTFLFPTCLSIFLPSFSSSTFGGSPFSSLMQFLVCWSGKEGLCQKPEPGICPILPPTALSDSQYGGLSWLGPSWGFSCFSW